MLLLRSYFSSALSGVPRRRFLLFGTVFLLALLGTGLAWLVSQRTSTILRYHFVPGQRLVFRLEYLSAAALDLDRAQDVKGLSSALSRTAHISVRGELVVQVLAVEGQRVRLACRLRRPSIQVALDGFLNFALGEALEADLQRTLFVRADPSGRILCVRRSPGRSSVSFGLQRALLATTQVVLPGPAAEGVPSWEVEENDLNGTALVRYETDAANAHRGERVRSLRKVRDRYLLAQRADEDEGGATLDYLPEGQFEVIVDVRDHHLVSLQGTEVTTALIQGQAVGRTENTVRLQFVRAETASAGQRKRLEAEEVTLAPASRWLPLLAGPTPEEAEASIQLAELGEGTLETLVAELARAKAGAAGALGETPLYLKFKALVYLHPEVSARLGQLLASAPAGSLTVRVLGPALANSGRAEAQAVLADVVRVRHKDGPALAELIPTLAQAKSPTPAVEAALFRLASETSEEVRSTAQLALGTLAHRLAAPAPARADAIVRWALNEIKAANSSAEQRQMLLVLGNAGSSTVLPVLRVFLSAREPEVRGGAVAALRRQKTPEAEAALCQAFTADPDASVRLEAARVLGTRRLTAVGLAAHALVLRKDSSPGVRLVALRNLGQSQALLPEAAGLIREVVKKDLSPEVRAAAAALLGEIVSPDEGT